MGDGEVTTIEVGEGAARRSIAVRRRAGRAPVLLWLGGFKSDMKGTKAEAIDRFAASQGRACIRFDYSGHGESGGAFADGSIGRWLEESRAVFSRFCDGPTIAIGIADHHAASARSSAFLAASSLPVPRSPMISTGRSTFATRLRRS